MFRQIGIHFKFIFNEIYNLEQMNDAINNLEDIFSKTVHSMKNSSQIWNDFSRESNRLSLILSDLKPAMDSYSASLNAIGEFFCCFSGCEDIGSTIGQLSSQLGSIAIGVESMAKLTKSTILLQTMVDMWRENYTMCENKYYIEILAKLVELKEIDRIFRKCKKKKSNGNAGISEEVDPTKYKISLESRNYCFREVMGIQEENLSYVFDCYRTIGCLFAKYIKPLLSSLIFICEDLQNFHDYGDQLAQASEIKSVPSTNIKQMIAILTEEAQQDTSNSKVRLKQFKKKTKKYSFRKESDHSTQVSTLEQKAKKSIKSILTNESTEKAKTFDLAKRRRFLDTFRRYTLKKSSKEVKVEETPKTPQNEELGNECRETGTPIKWDRADPFTCSKKSLTGGKATSGLEKVGTIKFTGKKSIK